jgi:hypothetical protein
MVAMSHHEHDHSHTHDADTFYLDQICMVGVSGAFGAVCLAMYFWQTAMLNLLLGPQFHGFVLFSGVALLFIALVRGATLWRQAGRTGHAHAHEHEHDHEHEHAHAIQDGSHEHGVSAHEHGHAHGHHHHHHGHDDHHHDHDAADHDHGWAPWRYVLLLVPIVLFLLGLPNKGPQADTVAVHVDLTNEAAVYSGLIASAPAVEGQLLTYLAAMYLADSGEVTEVPFQNLLDDANSADMREKYRNTTIRVRGQFVPALGSDRLFRLVRYRIKCCGADAIPVPIPALTRDSLASRSDLKSNVWVKVTAAVDFQKTGGGYAPVLRVMDLKGIQTGTPDANPYLQ